MFLAVALVSSLTLVLDTRTQNTSIDKPACAVQPALPWCAATIPAGRPITQEDLEDAVGFSRRGLTIVPDLLPWASHYVDAKAAKGWNGNCVTVTFTILDYLSRQGVDMANVRRALVTRDGSKTPDHMVALVQMDGKWIVVGDTTRQLAPYPLEIAKWSLTWTAPINSTTWNRTKIVTGS